MIDKKAKTKRVRRTGLTTGLILQAFSRASLDPTIWVTFRDHYHTSPSYSSAIIKHMAEMAKLAGLEYDFRIKDGVVQLRFPVRRIVEARQRHRDQERTISAGCEA